MRAVELVAVTVDRPHPWAAGVVRFGLPGDLWWFYGTKLDRARAAVWARRNGGADGR